MSSKIDIFNTERNQQQEELISYYDFMAKNKNIDSYREKINFNLNLLTEKIPQEIDEEKFLLQLNDMAKYSSVNIIEMMPKNKSTQDNLKQEEIELVLQGDYFAIVDFLHQLNLNSRLVSIQDSNIFIQNNTINAKLTLQIYANN
ncbi:MAG: type 4a pilus biogenesis protein PilO [Megamonas funiformis]|uniref:type 4a pilus biogenesis protein PilO n=1 Tax=Megamonas funiformis TaxID=437897 RepID=UPI00242F421E|nr:type 4a pilus biogenesis protein PilO [Megamonas funiformis]MDY3874663.1 type 4a pilus biogenesis protein PilO [Megamonas funiformis]